MSHTLILKKQGMFFHFFHFDAHRLKWAFREGNSLYVHKGSLPESIVIVKLAITMLAVKPVSQNRL